MSILLKPKEAVNVQLTVSTILSPENSSDDMEYSNVAEIIKYTTLTGRRTASEGVDAQTIGNINISSVGYRNSHETLRESDTSISEKITLTPPTGGDYIFVKDTRKIIVITVFSLIILGLGIIFVPRVISKIKNRKFIK